MTMLQKIALVLTCLTVCPASACETALLLSIDVSGSIDGGDYRLQTEALAATLSDADVVFALVQDQVRQCRYHNETPNPAEWWASAA